MNLRTIVLDIPVFPLSFVISLQRRGCVIVHNRDCVLSHDPRTRLLRMNIVNILLNLASPPDKPVSARLLLVGPFPFSVFHDCPSPTELATQWRDHQQRRDIHRKSSKSRQEINPHGQIQARNLERNSPQIQTWRGGSWHIVERVNLVGSHGKSKKSTC